jgi:branched-chain amino acid aminotransferase
MDACRIRLQVYASEDGGSEDQAAGYVISCGPLPARQEGGIRLGISTGAVKDPGPLSRFKTCNALPYRIAAREAAAVGWDDAILLNSIGQVVETSKSNIFLVKGGTVFVNNGAEGCIAGVMCGQLLEWMQEWSFQVTKCSLTIDALEGADEIFLTNSLRGVMPVTHLILPNHATERSLDIHFGEQLARLVEQKFMALHH